MTQDAWSNVTTHLVRRLLGAGLAFATALTAFTLISAPSAAADPSANDWARVRMCESSNNYAINTGNGYYGAYQFNLATWQSVGGAGRPDLNSPAEQDYRALYLYRMRGWQPWTCAGLLNLTNDSSAMNKIVPTYAESAYIGGGGQTPPPTSVSPPSSWVPPVPATPMAPISPIEALLPPAGSGLLVEPALPILTFAYGSCTPVVALWQTQMNRYGYGFDSTGCYGSKTKAAVQQLQYANGIRATDNIGPLTLIAAYLGRAPR
jgi:hypothetical protein